MQSWKQKSKKNNSYLKVFKLELLSPVSYDNLVAFFFFHLYFYPHGRISFLRKIVWKQNGEHCCVSQSIVSREILRFFYRETNLPKREGGKKNEQFYSMNLPRHSNPPDFLSLLHSCSSLSSSLSTVLLEKSNQLKENTSFSSILESRSCGKKIDPQGGNFPLGEYTIRISKGWGIVCGLTTMKRCTGLNIPSRLAHRCNLYSIAYEVNLVSPRFHILRSPYVLPTCSK